MDTITNLLYNNKKRKNSQENIEENIEENSQENSQENIEENAEGLFELYELPNVYSDNSLNKEENIMLNLLNDIKNSTEKIKEENERYISDTDIDKIVEKNSKMTKNVIENIYNQEKNIKYVVVALNTVAILGGLGMLFFSNTKNKKN